MARNQGQDLGYGPPLFLATVGPLFLCLYCFKLILDMMTCSKQIEFHACWCCNRLYKSCLEVQSNRFWHAYANFFIACVIFGLRVTISSTLLRMPSYLIPASVLPKHLQLSVNSYVKLSRKNTEKSAITVQMVRWFDQLNTFKHKSTRLTNWWLFRWISFFFFFEMYILFSNLLGCQ